MPTPERVRTEDLMRLVRLGTEPSAIGADVRTALTTWGAGRGVFGGIAVIGCQPQGCPRPLDAVLVLPRGIIVVVGVDLAEPVLALEAPMHTPWTVDGWPMVRTEGAVNPALEALESAAALAKSLQDRQAEPLPVTTIIAVGPYVDRVTQPTQDLHRGVRVVCPTTTSMLAAARELATYERACPADPAAAVLRTLGVGTGHVGLGALVDEGFPDVVSADLATSETMLLQKITDEPAAPPSPPRPGPQRAVAGATKATLARRRMVTLAIVVLVACVVIVMLLMSSTTGNSDTEPDAAQAVEVDGVEFTPVAQQRDRDCASAAFGDVQLWFSEHGCASLDRALYDVEVSEGGAGVATAVVEFPSTTQAEELEQLFDQAGTGGLTDLVAEGQGWEHGPKSFDGAAWAVTRESASLRVVQAVWSHGSSNSGDAELRTLAEQALALPARP